MIILAPSGAQDVTVSVSVSVCLLGTSLAKAQNLHLSLLDLSLKYLLLLQTCPTFFVASNFVTCIKMRITTSIPLPMSSFSVPNSYPVLRITFNIYTFKGLVVYHDEFIS